MLSEEEAKKFHGHLGPYLLLGYIAGKYAVDKLRPKNEFELKAMIKCPLKTPFSCAIDGLQCSSSCTFGKGNIKVEDGNDIEIEVGSGNKRIFFKVRKEVLKKLEELDMEEGVKWLRSLQAEKIYKIE